MQRVLASIALIALAAAGTASAQSASRAHYELSEAPNMHGTLDLSLADAIAMGLENNLAVEIERHAPLIAEEDYLVSWGAYDPILGGEGGFNNNKQPQGNPLFTDDRTHLADGNANLRGMVPYLGATYSVDFDGGRSDNDSFIQTFNPQYTSGLSFTGTLPLLRGLVWNEAWTGVRSTGVRRDATDETFRESVQRAVQGIENQYWRLIADREQLGVARKSLETAEALLDQLKTQYEVGVVSRVEVVEADAGVADREFNLIVVDNRYRRSQDELINVVLGPHLTAGSTLVVKPTEAPDAYTEFEVDVENAVGRAFVNRPDLRAAELDVEGREVELQFRRNQRLPQLDVRGGYRFSGLSGRNGTVPAGSPAPPPPFPDAAAGVDFRDAPGAFGGANGGDGWEVRGIVSIPIGNIAGRHGVGAAQLTLRRSEVELQQLRQTIILEVRDAARTLRSSIEGIEAAERGRLAAAEQLRAERVRLEHGESTPFDVLLRESDLVEAESQKIEALRSYRASETELLRAQGTILAARNVVFEDVAPLR